MKTYAELRKEVDKILAEDDGAVAPSFISMREAYALAKEDLRVPPDSVQLPGWLKFNELTGGLRPNEFTILCGPTGSGKTTWLANLSAQLTLGGVNHFVASVETGAVDFMRRLMSAIAERDYNDGDKVPESEIQEYEDSFGHIMKAQRLFLSKYTAKVSPRKLLCDLKKAHDIDHCKVAILDNLNFLLPFVSADNERVAMDQVVHEFIIFCKHVDMHVIMVMHPRKKENGRVETEFDIKGSSTVVQEAHNVLLMNRLSEDDIANGYLPSCRDLKFAKLRRRGKNVYKRIIYRNRGSAYDELAVV